MTAFVLKFRTLAAKAKITDDAVLAALFKRAVRSNLLGKMLNLENPPSTMAGWYDLVLRLDSRQVYSGGYSGGGEQRSYQNTGQGSGRLNEPMDIDAMAPKERQRHQELGLCFYCHKQGHLFRTITHSVALRYQWKGTTKVVKAYIAGIGWQDIILGHEWLQKENPVIDWKSGQMKFNNHKHWTGFEQNESLIRHDRHQETIRRVAVETPSFDEFLRQSDEKEQASCPKKPMQELVDEPQKILRTTIEEVPNSEWDFSPDPPDEPTSSILDEPIEELPNHPPMNPHDDPPEQEEDYETRIRSITNDLDPDEFLASYTPGTTYLATLEHDETPLTQEFEEYP
ncbi:hypothetical protein DAEQUDRAFT_767071 [Daedalea quercina L-15889]|uniref:Uncharacterized protein n=1 Tax=Daedalea quercina L-15889 TaxID=1314783 RepID=A0A165NY11_9APHY|nr:hypothetical protein DAEQUDRAFT_767071 [Daedalea quercina L-15889]